MSAGAKGMAAADAAEAEKDAARDAVGLDRLARVFAARGGEAAPASQQGRQGDLIKADRKKKKSSDHEGGRRRAFRQSRKKSSHTAV